MALTQLAPPYPVFTDKNGDPLDNGYLYFGEVNKNPETNPIQVYYDSAFTQPAAQPLRTSNGYVMRNGSPALIYADSQFSVTIRDKNNALVIYSPVGYGVDPASISGSVSVQDHTGDGVTVTFGMGASPSTINATNVYIDGVYQEKDTYTISGTNLTFSEAPPLNAGIEIVVQESSILGGATAGQVSYNQGDVGAVNTTVKAKLQERVSVKDFGATGDGVTDDTTAIQAAIDAMIAIGGGSVYFPDGEYFVSDPGLTLSSNITLFGNGFSSTLVTDGVSLTGYWMIVAYGVDELNKISNVQVRGLHFKSTGASKQAFNGFFIDDLVLRDNFVSGMGLGGTSDPTQSPAGIGSNSSNSYGAFTSRGNLNRNILITGNKGFCNNDTTGDYSAAGVGAAIGYSANWVVSNNVFSYCRWGIWANGGQGYATPITDLRKCRRGTFVGNSIEFCRAGIWWSMCENVVASGNTVSTCEDVGIDPEASNDCIVVGNEVSHAKTGCYAQFSLSTNVSFLSNSAIQDGVPRGVTSWSGTRCYMDSSAGTSTPDNRENILKNNTFIYKAVTGVGNIFVNYSEKTIIQNNTFHNVVIQTQPSSSTSFNCRFNTFYIENTTSSGITVIDSPNGTGNVGSGQDPMLICDNMIKIKSAHADTIGIDAYCVNFQEIDSHVSRNVVKGAPVSINLTIGSTLAAVKYTYLIDNVVDGAINSTALYSGSYNARRARLVWEGNKDFDGNEYFDGPPEKWYWNRGQRFYYNTVSSGGYIGAVVTSAGALYKEVWSSGGTYLTGEFVLGSDSNVYIAIADGGQALDPVLDTGNTYWEAYSSEAGVVKDFGQIA